ncbi:hypothetical protein CH275_06145 [Rhodococcus sp. 06-235-1A]|nr:hypothetical protein CH275_06145 [Rhodococcus sp. 06-235-1A]
MHLFLALPQVVWMAILLMVRRSYLLGEWPPIASRGVLGVHAFFMKLCQFYEEGSGNSAGSFTE